MDWLGALLKGLLAKNAVDALSKTLIDNDVTTLQLLLSCSDADLVELVPSFGQRKALMQAIAVYKKDVKVSARASDIHPAS